MPRENQVLKYFFFLSALEGTAATAWLLLSPSMERSARWLGLSGSRLVFTGVVLSLTLVFACLAWKGWRSETWLAQVSASLQLKIQNDRWLAALVSLGVCATLALSLGIFLASTVLRRSGEWYVVPAPLLQTMSIITSIVDRALFAWIWAVLLFAQALAVVLTFSWNRLPGIRQLLEQAAARTGYWLLSLFFTSLHWIYLGFQVTVFSIIPNWFWKFYNKPLQQPWLLLPLFFVGIGGVWFVLNSRAKIAYRLALLVLLGYVLQVGFGWVEGSGYTTLLQNYLEKGHYSFTRLASREPGAWQVLTNYETASGGDSFILTKPPGAVLVYLAAQKIANIFSPETTETGRYLALSRFIVIVFPLLASLAPPLIYLTARRLEISSHPALLSAAAFIFFPNFLLTPFELDQSLYPLITIGIIYLALRMTGADSSWGWAVGCGAGLYLACFISFSLIPLVVLVGIWITLKGFTSIRQVTRQVIGLFAGAAGIYLLFRLAFQYDALSRYLAAVERHRLHKDFIFTLPNVLEAAYVNNAEWLLWIGAPFALLILFQCARALLHLLQKRFRSLDELAISFIGMFLLLNIVGQTRTEVARLWLFLVPFLSIFCGVEMEQLLGSRKKSVLWVFGLQLLTAFLIFRFQDMD